MKTPEKGEVTTPNSNHDLRGFVKLFIAKRLIGGSAAAILGIFVPIFLYETVGQQFHIVGIYYAIMAFLYLIFIIPGMHIANRIGFSHTLVLAGVLNVAIFVIMYHLTPENLTILLAPLALLIAGFRVFHWVPFHVDFTLFTNTGERGRLVGLSFATIAFLGVIGPILAGFIIANAGYQTLFAIAIALIVASTIAYIFVPETDTKFTWSAKETWSQLFSKKHRGIVVGEFANGAEIMVNVIIWPIFLFEILNGDVFEIGAVSTTVVAFTIVLQLLLGKKLDQTKNAKEKTLKVGSWLYALGWILKMFVFSAAHVFFVGLYHNIVKIFTKTPFSAIVYDMASEQGEFVDEFSVVREMAGQAGRATCLLIASALSFFIPIGWTFLIAVFASIALNFVYRMKMTS